MKTIPLNSLVFLIGVDRNSLTLFDSHEYVDVNTIQDSLVGSAVRPDLESIFHYELERFVEIKLGLGQRVVIDSPDLPEHDRKLIAKNMRLLGFNVFNLVNPGSNICDASAETIVISQIGQIVAKLPDVDFMAAVKARGFDGITVVADVHGMLHPFQNAMAWAKHRNHYMILLGDLLDYGIDSLEVIEQAYQLVIRGHGEAIMGNHERKIYRYLQQMVNQGSSKMKLSHGNQVTVDRVMGLGTFEFERWVAKFFALVNMMRNHRVGGDFIFTHGAVMPEMWTNFDQRLSGDLESAALFGEVDKEKSKLPGPPHRTYNWVDLIPGGKTAIVGHDIRGKFQPFTQENENGGKAIFLDTGCGKQGHLSTVDIRFTQSGPKIENFNIH